MDARARVHRALRLADQGGPRDKDALFACLVRANRANGIDPHRGDEQPGPVGYVHAPEVPLRGDVYWDGGRVMSREAADRRFSTLKL